MLAGLLALLILVMKLFHETAAARWLHRCLVEVPLARASRIRRSDILFILVLLAAGQSLALLGSVDLAMLYAVDLSLYLDAAIAVSAAAAAASLRARWTSVKALLRAPLRRKTRRPARPRSRRSRPLPRTGNDDESLPLAA
jgi:type IV secretory pathway VirB6-like protein